MYFGEFTEREDLERQFNVTLPENIKIVFACYDVPDYEGYASVLYFDTSNRKFYEVYGSHCSCYGLEDQWEPEEVILGDVVREVESDHYLGWGPISYKPQFREAICQFIENYVTE